MAVYDTRGDQEYEYVEDRAVASTASSKRTSKLLVAIARPSARIGKWALLSRDLTETCQFSVRLRRYCLRPGMVIDVADPVRAGSRIQVAFNLQQQHRSQQIAAMT